MVKIYELIDEWKKKNNMPVFEEGSFPPSKYRDLRNAIQDENVGGIKKELENTEITEEDANRLLDSFDAAIDELVRQQNLDSDSPE